MTPPTNASNAEVAILEVKMEGRMSSMETTFANFIELMNERQRIADERYRASEARMDRMEAMIADIRVEIRSLRVTIVVTAVSSVLAAVLGISAFNAALYSNMLAAFQAGSDMTATQAEVRRIVEETAVLLKRAQNEQNKKEPAKPPPSD